MIKTKKKLVTTSFRVDADLLKELKAHNVNLSVSLRACLRRLLKTVRAKK